ncbi:plasma membrane SNARE protein [Rhodotorula toruloides]|uniref:Plasma membrane SNARE protein n=1 Tax=Rhodotorula toruloides TaxID=5286 RepID=A0A511K6S1_RHOTO|nr:plasma membrane SNARE protein [Rhodotorula toruloides]
MGLFGGKKKDKIPEVGGPSSYNNSHPGPAPSLSGTSSYSANPPPSYRTAPPYVPPSQGGQGYAQTSHFNRQQAPPHQGFGQGEQRPPVEPAGGKAKGSWFGKKKGEDVEARNELLQGAPAQGPPASSSRYGPGGGGDPYSPAQGGYGQDGQQAQQFENEEDEEVEGIKQQMRFVKQESLASTRNALRIARETEETARATLDRLGEQSDRIANTERHLDLAKAHNDRAVDETKELEALNRSIFRPTFTFNKQAKRDREERRLLDRHNAEKSEREQVRREQYESRQRIDNAFNRMDRDAENAAGAKARAKARGSERTRYQFEAAASDDEIEDEMDDNLNNLAHVTGNLSLLAKAMGTEVDGQNKKLGRITDKADVLDNKIIRSTQHLGRIK